MTIDPRLSASYRRLLELQAAVHAFNREAAFEYDVDETARDHPLWYFHFNYLSVAPFLGGLHVEYHGSTYDAPFDLTMACLSEQPVAERIMR